MLFGYLLSTQRSRFSLQHRYAQGVKELSPDRFASYGAPEVARSMRRLGGARWRAIATNGFGSTGPGSPATVFGPERAFAVREALGAKASDVGRSVVEFACGSAEDFTAAKFRTCWSDEYCTTPAPIAV